jgi:hypothetical protein
MTPLRFIEIVCRLKSGFRPVLNKETDPCYDTAESRMEELDDLAQLNIFGGEQFHEEYMDVKEICADCPDCNNLYNSI